ncbi:MAG: hypothetical protein WC454_07975 [Phycisphaerae bacterium]|jgi:hypothetical protein
MNKEKLEKLLNELAGATAEPVQPYLAEHIKNQIPQQLSAHKGGIDTVNIIIDLRISKLAAAAAIILTMILFANFFGGRSQENAGMYQNGKLLLKYCFGGIDTDRNKVLTTAKSKYEYLAQLGKDVVYYGDSFDPRDSDAILVQWKLSDSEYKVLFGDLRERTVSAEELIRLQGRMLQKKGK